MDFITCDRTYKVGDLVFSTYHKTEYLWKITEITRRYVGANDISFYGAKGGKIGDETNPYMSLIAVANLSITTDPTKKLRKMTAGLDGAWLKKATPEHIEAHIRKLNNLLNEM